MCNVATTCSLSLIDSIRPQQDEGEITKSIEESILAEELISIIQYEISLLDFCLKF